MNLIDLSLKTLIILKQILSDKSELRDRILNVLSFSNQVNNNLLNLMTENKYLVPILSNKMIFEMTESKDYPEYISILRDIDADCSLYKIKFLEIKSITDLPV